MESLSLITENFNYWVYVVIMMIGLYAMVSKNNLIKKLIGMSIFQTAIILFYVSIGYKEGATIPILYHDQVHPPHHAEGSHGSAESHHEIEHAVSEASKDAHAAIDEHGDHLEHADEKGGHGSSLRSLDINPMDFENPLVHVLMLTAIVVGVATLGVGLAITQKLYGEFGTIEEQEILEQIKSGND